MPDNMRKLFTLAALIAVLALAVSCKGRGAQNTNVEEEQPYSEYDEIRTVELPGGLTYVYHTDDFDMIAEPEVDEEMGETRFFVFMFNGDYDSSAEFRILHLDESLVKNWSEDDLEEVLEMDVTDASYVVYDREGFTLVSGPGFEPLDLDYSLPGYKMEYKGKFVYDGGGEEVEEGVFVDTILGNNIIIMSATSNGGEMDRLFSALWGFRLNGKPLKK